MRGVRSGFATASVASIFAVAVVIGCSASGTDGTADTSTPTDPTAAPPSVLPPSSDGTGDVDASKSPSSPKDAGKDSTVDAGPPPPVPGSACATVDAVKTKPCGACGTASTICLAGAGDGGVGDAGAGGTWSDYGVCENELVGGCVPGSVVTQACGNCGTQVKTCSQYCGFTVTACAGQPASSCVPGAVDLSNAGCGADTYRQRTCQSTCTYASYGATCDPAPTTIEVPPTVGGINFTIATLKATQTAPIVYDLCPGASIDPTTVTPYVYLQVHNPLATSVVVSIYNSQATGGPVFPTQLASYAGATAPTTDVQRQACVQGVNDFGNDLLTGDPTFSFASLDDVDAVTIAAGATVTIYVAAQDPYDPMNPTDSTGKLKLNVKTEQIN